MGRKRKESISNVTLEFGSHGDIIEINVKDYSGKTIERFKFGGNDGKVYGRTLRLIYEKYGFKPEVDFKYKIKEKTDEGFFDY